MATPMLETSSRCASRVEFSAITAKTTSPGLRYLRPSLRGISLQLGGKIEETRTILCEAIPASLRASSKELKRSLCLPTPLVKNSFFGTMLFPNFDVSSLLLKMVALVKGTRMSLTHSDGRQQDLRGICQPLLIRPRSFETLCPIHYALFAEWVGGSVAFLWGQISSADHSRPPKAAPARTISGRRNSRDGFQVSSSGLTHRSPGNRAKSRSFVYKIPPYSIVVAAKAASVVSFPRTSPVTSISRKSLQYASPGGMVRTWGIAIHWSTMD